MSFSSQAGYRTFPRSTKKNVPSRRDSSRSVLPPYWWLAPAIALFVLQLASGTDVVFASLVLAFVVATASTVMALGGISNLLGLCILVLAMQHVIISQIAKVFMWKPADAPLSQPILTMVVYVFAMGGMWMAAMAARLTGIGRRKPFITMELHPQKLFWGALIFTALAIIRFLAIATSGLTAEGEVVVGGFLGPLKTLTMLPALAVAMGTAHAIVSSGGKRSWGMISVVAIGATFFAGFVGAGRSSMAGALIPYILMCMALRFRFGWHHYAMLATVTYLAQMLLFPYAIAARQVVRTPNMATNVQLAVDLLADIAVNPIKYQTRNDKILLNVYSYYGEPMATLDRYTVINTTDALVNATVYMGTLGMRTITPGFEMLLPRFLYKDKPISSTSNFLAHRAPGMVNENDDTTQITMGFVADSFTCYGLAGAIVIPFFLAYFFFVIYSYLLDMRFANNVIYASLAFSLSWVFSESPIAVAIVAIFFQSVLTAALLWIIQRLINILAIDVTRTEGKARRLRGPALDRAGRY